MAIMRASHRPHENELLLSCALLQHMNQTFQEKPAFPSRRFHHLGSLPEELAELVPDVGHVVALDDDRVAAPAALLQPGVAGPLLDPLLDRLRVAALGHAGVVVAVANRRSLTRTLVHAILRAAILGGLAGLAAIMWRAAATCPRPAPW